MVVTGYVVAFVLIWSFGYACGLARARGHAVRLAEKFVSSPALERVREELARRVAENAAGSPGGPRTAARSGVRAN